MAAPESSLRKLEQLNAIGIALSRERDITSLLEDILNSAIDLTNADAGTIYLTSAAGLLEFKILINRTLGLQQGGRAGGDINLPDIAIFLPDGRPNDRLVAAYAAAHQTTVNIADAETAQGFDFSGTREFVRRTGYLAQSFLTVPLIDHEHVSIGVLQLINALDENGTVHAFNAEAQHLAESLASQAAVAFSNRQLIDQLAGLFEALVDVLSRAIDEKSPYTSKHCERVPILTMMLAERAAASREGSLADFQLSEAGRYELKIAAMLHDCGKVTTPVHVMDKATKLETLFDRIQLVDARFEILRRDAQIERLQALLATEDDADRIHIEQRFEARLRQLADDQDLLRRSNSGGEFMDPQHQADISTIARQAWIDADGRSQPLLNADEETCLRIARGTLSDEERKVINHHIDATISMLEGLPWPRHLRNVPAFAGGHHECPDGSGYPRGLQGRQLSVEARIMAIADIFEALTAADRPYKPAKPLSEALRIMSHMARRRHIDAELFRLFVRNRVYLDYARQYLLPEQLDGVDEADVLGGLDAADQAEG